jgi:uncharacterized protein with HEPN domain
MRPEDRVRIAHILEAAASIETFVRGRARKDLDVDQMFAFALRHAIEIIGEAASKISDEVRAELPAVPWPQIVAMRNRLAHAYFDIDNDVLWKTAADEVPRLAEQLKVL